MFIKYMEKSHLPPLGKITVFNTSDYLLQELKSLFYSFLRDNKPVKLTGSKFVVTTMMVT